MLYNISFDIAAILVLGVLAFGLNTVLYTEAKTSKLFRRYIYMVIINSSMDIITAYTISYAPGVNDLLNQILNSMYQISSALSVIMGIECVFFYMGGIRKADRIISKTMGISYLAMLTINIPFGFIFDFVNHEYIHGPFFYSTYVISFLIVIQAIVSVFLSSNIQTKSHRGIVLFFLSLPIIFCIIQMFVGNTLLNAFGESFAALIMLFALETPDYSKLMKTLKELEEAKAEANIANNSKSDFLADMSHEIRTPINGILGMDTMILRDCNDPQILEYAENIRIAGNGLLSIVNDILDLSKIESGRMELVPVKYELFSIMNDCYQMVRMRADEKGLKLIFANNPDIPGMYYGDEVRIRQIINNLVTNGLKYTKEGSVTLNIDYEPVSEDNLILIISVTDTGIGIKDEDKAKLFMAFTRLETNRNRTIEGTGLGLKITQSFVSMMGGTIEAESVYGEGSTFTVRLPQKIVEKNSMGEFGKRLSEHSGVAKAKTLSYNAAGKKILVVDDVKMNILVFKGLLKGSEAEIESALSGAECIELVSRKKYDLIFMDHLMPVMDGIETFHHVREDEGSLNKETPVIVLTANALVGVKEKYLNEGFNDYLSKPVEQPLLIKSMEKIFGQN